MHSLFDAAMLIPPCAFQHVWVSPCRRPGRQAGCCVLCLRPWQQQQMAQPCFTPNSSSSPASSADIFAIHYTLHCMHVLALVHKQTHHSLPCCNHQPPCPASRESLAPESLQAVGGTEQLQGFAALKPEDQHKVAAALGGSVPAPPAPPAEVRPAGLTAFCVTANNSMCTQCVHLSLLTLS
jgi:hypothetical protein